MSDWMGIVWLVVLLVANAFFVGAEFAVISARRSQIEPRAEAGSKRAKTALYAMEHATLMLATSQLGITVCSLLILNVSEPALHHLLEGPLGWTGLSAQVVSVTAFVLTLLIVTYLHVVFGEMIPKNAAFSVPDQAVLLLAPPLVAVSRVLKHIIAALNAIANGVLRMFGVEPKSETNSTYTLEEVASIVNHSTREGVLEDRSGALTAAFEFTTKRAEDLLVPAGRLVVLPSGATPEDVDAAVAKHGFSRYPIASQEGSLEGYVHIKDLVRLGEDRIAEPIPAKRIREMVSLHAETELEDVLARMQARGIHLARIHDSAGTELGVVFLEDVIEELVGEVHDATTRQRHQ
ncbi:hemolysin family protein [Leucobacter luti]|uniref:CBS domain containing-hemolysin-like protein n=1 Tax=Leucobacter luti TaxID=340320 RepID=A0A4R6S407_9MICO|nr:hemolysin family protein [Leucobacter luti]MCW2287201.1 CBS domain containing-hemolysin-like protein [Leucobacter luti]QYM76716.1 hemolysin family protein [Leucobacter luti]TCK41427.1 CBS domain containing-hemolysin-like protein [Leucobacter luti]TDP94402.1 CBS domain containing-hemolysin-like protein [Leucobacter luti]